MAIDIGDAILDVGRDNTALKRGLSSDLGMVKQQMAKMSRVVGLAMTAIGVSIVAGLGSMVKSFADTGDAFQKMSLRTGISVEALSELSHAAELSGTSIEGLENGVRKMQRAITEALAGEKTFQDAFVALGLTFDDLANKSPEEQFNVIVTALADVEDATTRASMAQEIFGKSGTALLPMLANGAKGLAGMRKEAHELGIVMSQEQADAAAEFNDAWLRVSQALTGIKNVIAPILIPILTSLAEWIKEITIRIRTWIEAHPELAATITKVVGAIGVIFSVVGPMLIAFGVILGAISFKIVAIAAIISGVLVIAFLAMRDMLAKAVVWVKANWDQIEETFITAGAIIKLTIELLVEALKAIFVVILSVLKGFGLSILDTWDGISGDTETGSETTLDTLQRFAEFLKIQMEWAVFYARQAGDWLEENWGDIAQGIRDFNNDTIQPIIAFGERMIWLGGVVFDAVSKIVEAFRALSALPQGAFDLGSSIGGALGGLAGARGGGGAGARGGGGGGGTGARGGGGGAANVTVNVNGPVAGDLAGFAKMISDEVSSSIGKSTGRVARGRGLPALALAGT